MDAPLVLLVRLWVRQDRIPAFEAFERRAATLMAAHGGRIERVIRRSPEPDPEAPFETHVVTFPTRSAFDRYRADPEYHRLAPDRDAVVERTEITFGRDVAPYSRDDASA